MCLAVNVALPVIITCSKIKLQLGFNVDVIQLAAYLHNDVPVIEASDEALAIQYISSLFFYSVLNSLIL